MSFINRYRLPISLYSPQFIDEQEKFRKSDGTTVVLSNIVRKQYDVRTDYMPEKWHERLKIALAHDNTSIEGEKYIGGVTQEGAYTIDWPDFLNYPLGPATFKVEVQGFNASNSNCGTCAEYSQVVCEDDDIGTIGEDETVIIPILYNDAICCSPFEISVVTFNSLYLQSCDIVGNTLVIHTKTGIPSQDNVLLATYRVTCENGMFDEASVFADVEGSVEECFIPAGLTLTASTSTTATFDWGSRPDTCGYDWALYLASDLGTPVQDGHLDDSVTELEIIGLTPSTNYVFFLQRDCCDGDLSPFTTREFTTNPPVEADTCGEYEVGFENSCGNPGFYATISYLDCLDSYQNATIYTYNAQNICMKQIAPGTPVYYEIIDTNVPPECLANVTTNYIGTC